MNTEEKARMIGLCLDAMKSITQEDNRLSEVGVHIGCFGDIESYLWNCIKLAAGMPDKEKLGVWVSDYWLDFSFLYDEGEISREEAITRILNWKSDFKD